MVLDFAKQVGAQDAMTRVRLKLSEKQSQEKAKLHGLPYIDLILFPVDLKTIALIPKDEAVTGNVVSFFREHNELKIGVIDPENVSAKTTIARLQKDFHVDIYVISAHSFEKTLSFYSKIVTPKAEAHEGVLSPNTLNVDVATKLLKDTAWQKKTSASEVLGTIFGLAMVLEASDIHLEPDEESIRLRCRVDGVLQDLAHLDRSLHNSLISRIKLQANLKLNIVTTPQDGRLTAMWGEQPVDIRVSVLPSAFGESVVMRLLGVGAASLRLSSLGFQGKAEKVIRRQLDKPNGAILTTGPTGSGKTTTLYAFLSELNKPGVKIITLEDPVEYKISGIQQTPIDSRAKLTFASGLRSILRQDPDVVMVGEIRDQETAETALQAALTGHVVLSTLHTNDAAGAVPRLFSMGVKPFVIAPAINVVIAQRLVRRLCQYCRRPAQLPSELIQKVKESLNKIPVLAELPVASEPKFSHSPGCQKCGGLGYKGRIGVYEVLEVTDNMRELILKEASLLQMYNLAVQEGMATMQQDGIVKASLGLTDIEEVVRVTGSI